MNDLAWATVLFIIFGGLVLVTYIGREANMKRAFEQGYYTAQCEYGGGQAITTDSVWLCVEKKK